jgi:hypothetical protein
LLLRNPLAIGELEAVGEAEAEAEELLVVV